MTLIINYKNNHNKNHLLQSYKKRIQHMSEEERIKSIKDAQIRMVSAKYDQRPDPQPTYREINQCLQLLQLKIPNKNITKLIKILHTNMLNTKIKKKQDKQQSSLAVQNIDMMKGENTQPDSKQFKRKRKSFDNKHYYIRDTFYQPKFMTVQDEIKFKQKRMVAQAFCHRQYGVQALQDEASFVKFTIPIQRQRYCDLITSVVTEAFRRLERFLIQQCRRNIRTLNRYQMSAIYVLLCRCREHIQLQECITFFKFVTLVYGLDKVAISEQAAIKLYIAIQKGLISKIGEKELDRIQDKKRKSKLFRQSQTKRIENQKQQFQRFWTKELYYDLIDWYLKDQLYSKVRVHFTQRFATKDYLFTVQTIRSKLFRVLRMSIKKVAYYTQKYKQDMKEQILKLNGDVTRLILKCPNALNVRLLLIDFYKKDQCEVRQLNAIIKAINEYIISWQKRKSNQVIEAAVPITNSKEKIDQNIAITNDRLREGFRKYGKEDIIFKEQQKNYHHIVQIQKGVNLHYYKKVDPNPLMNIITVPISHEVKQQPVYQQKKLQIPNQELGYNFCVRYAGIINNKQGEKNLVQCGSQNQQINVQSSMDSEQNRLKKSVTDKSKQVYSIHPLQLKIKEMMERCMGFVFPVIK